MIDSNSFEVRISGREKIRLNYARYPGEVYMGERIVEVPIAVYWLKQWMSEQANIVEVGNVIPQWLPRYGMKCTWPVWDLFDPSVVQKDAVDGDYHGLSVLSVSTLEHVGREDYGCKKSEPEKCKVAFDKITSEAKEFLITIPIGYNNVMDEHASKSGLPCFMMCQINAEHEWTQIPVTPEEWKSLYGQPFPLGNVVAFIHGGNQ